MHGARRDVDEVQPAVRSREQQRPAVRAERHVLDRGVVERPARDQSARVAQRDLAADQRHDMSPVSGRDHRGRRHAHFSHPSGEDPARRSSGTGGKPLRVSTRCSSVVRDGAAAARRARGRPPRSSRRRSPRASPAAIFGPGMRLDDRCVRADHHQALARVIEVGGARVLQRFRRRRPSRRHVDKTRASVVRRRQHGSPVRADGEIHGHADALDHPGRRRALEQRGEQGAAGLRGVVQGDALARQQQ